jgi:hypothetical protein
MFIEQTCLEQCVEVPRIVFPRWNRSRGEGNAVINYSIEYTSNLQEYYGMEYTEVLDNSHWESTQTSALLDVLSNIGY